MHISRFCLHFWGNDRFLADLLFSQKSCLDEFDIHGQKTQTGTIYQGYMEIAEYLAKPFTSQSIRTATIAIYLVLQSTPTHVNGLAKGY